jgi:AcrR family transcriptional regulator
MMTAVRARRADAVRNHERVIAAARELFAARGLNVGMDEIAARAGVGKATIYRSYPTKDHLIAALAGDRLRWFAELARAGAESADAWGAFSTFILAASEAQAGDRSLADVLAASLNVAEAQDARRDVQDAVQHLMTLANAQGTMRPDARPEDVRVFFAGVAAALQPEEREDPAIWRRYAEMFLAGLRA